MGGEPYRFFNIDYFAHQEGDPRGEYGSLPYVHAQHPTHAASVAWMNSADTWVDIIPRGDEHMMVTFASESGVIEFFMMGTTQSPKKILKDVTTITGHAVLPPIYALGYHFSKYADVSADIMLERDADFEGYGFPVDVYWMDILYSKNYEYFVFDEQKFPPRRLHQMNEQVNRSHQTIAIASSNERTDPWRSPNQCNYQLK